MNKMNLEDLEWKEFKIGEIFKLEDREQKQVPTGAYIKNILERDLYQE